MKWQRGAIAAIGITTFLLGGVALFIRAQPNLVQSLGIMPTKPIPKAATDFLQAGLVYSASLRTGLSSCKIKAI